MLELSAIGGIVGVVLLLAAVRFHAQKRKLVARSIVVGLAVASAAGIVIIGSLTGVGVIDKQLGAALYLWSSASGAAIGAWRGHTTERRRGLCPTQRGKDGCSVVPSATKTESKRDGS